MTNRELAAIIGVSPAALSLVINHKPGISEATRSLVTNRLHELGYDHLFKKPNPAASNIIAFVTYKPLGEYLNTRPLYWELMEHIEKKAREYGYNVILHSFYSDCPLSEQLSQLIQTGCKGAIIMAAQISEEIFRQFLLLPFPVISMEKAYFNMNCGSVYFNHQMGIYQALEYLTSCGFKRIGYLKSKYPLDSYIERFQAFCSFLPSFGLQLLPEDVVELRLVEKDCYEDMCGYLKEKPTLPPVFLCDDDIIAYGVIHALQEYNYRIPEDISIMGYNDRPDSENFIPPLTTISVSRVDFSYTAVEEILRMISAPLSTSRSRKIAVGSRVMKRQSVKSCL